MRGLRVLITILIILMPSLTFCEDILLPFSGSLFFQFGNFQESSLNLNILNLKNNIEEFNTSHDSNVINSFKENIGLFNLNQASGSLNNQSNIAIMTFISEKGLSDFEIDYLNVSIDNSVKIYGKSYRQNLIENSFDNSKGVFMVNQSSGNLNQQSNVFIFSMGSALVLKDIELDTKRGGNFTEYTPDADIERKDILRNSFSGSSGAAIISQSSGDINTIRNTIGISFSMEIIR